MMTKRVFVLECTSDVFADEACVSCVEFMALPGHSIVLNDDKVPDACWCDLQRIDLRITHIFVCFKRDKKSTDIFISCEDSIFCGIIVLIQG